MNSALPAVLVLTVLSALGSWAASQQKPAAPPMAASYPATKDNVGGGAKVSGGATMTAASSSAVETATKVPNAALSKPTAATAAAGPLSAVTWEKIAGMRPLFDGRTLDGWIQAPLTPEKASWIVKDGAMASTGAGRGVIYTKEDFTRYRLVFTMRHLSGNPDHQPCVLVFCTRPAPGERGLDALGGIQFQTPNGGHWDYRPGHNNAGNDYFTRPVRTTFDNKQWHQVEILVDAKTGVARMAVAQPVGTRAIENCVFRDPRAGKTGPLAWQMHNAGLFDEFKDVRIEIDPTEDRLITIE